MTSEAVNRIPGTKVLSVVVVVFVGDECLPSCLDHLALEVRGRTDLEVIVSCDDRLEERERWESEYPWVRWLHQPGSVHPSVLRARGVREASGHHIALLEDHCQTAPGWCAAALNSGSTPVQGGPIQKAEPDTPLNWAGYFLEFAYYMPRVTNTGDRASDCNTTYTREALQSVRSVWEKEFHETNVNWALQDQGVLIVRAPGQLVYESHPLHLKDALKERLAFGRTFADSRCQRLSRSQQLAYAIGTPLLPALLTLRMGRIAAKHSRFGAFLRAYPWFLLLASAWTLGEVQGYLSPRSA